jgi:Zinc finger protein
MHRFPGKERYSRQSTLLGTNFTVPAIVRDALVDEYCLHDPLKPRAKADYANHDCLIRIYLGRKRERRTSGAPRQLWFALWNFKMDLQRLTDLGVDTKSFAKSIAAVLAVMHWHSELDARDVEFVLGGLPTEIHHPKPTISDLRGRESTSKTLLCREEGRAASLWLLDFNQCRRISMDLTGVDVAVDAFCVNDPYYPRPNVDEKLWTVSREAYLSASAEIVGCAGNSSLPGLFIEGVAARLNSSKGGEYQVVQRS